MAILWGLLESLSYSLEFQLLINVFGRWFWWYDTFTRYIKNIIPRFSRFYAYPLSELYLHRFTNMLVNSKNNNIWADNTNTLDFKTSVNDLHEHNLDATFEYIYNPLNKMYLFSIILFNLSIWLYIQPLHCNLLHHLLMPFNGLTICLL